MKLKPPLIALIAPSSPVDRVALRRGLRQVARRLGPCRLLAPAGLFRRAGYLAGEDADRLAVIRRAFASDADVVWCCRGGYGATRLVHALDWKRLARSGKTLIGFSDATALLVAYAAAGGRAVHAPMPGSDLAAGGGPRAWRSLAVLGFQPGEDRFTFRGVAPARAVHRLEGRILAGNLAVLASLAGTRFLPSGRGRVIFLEDVTEEPYRLDRFLTQLTANDFFRGARGVVFGRMHQCVAEHPSRSFTAAETLARFAADWGGPVLTGFPFGHGGANTALPLEGRVLIEKRGRDYRALIKG